MKTKLGIFSVILLTGLLVSCVTGEYMAMKPKENAEVLGTIHATFFVPGAFRYKSTINRQAYISLMAEAQKQYPDTIVDIRDISWVIGQGDVANNNYEYSAIGKVIKK
jgi:hypothetical protein